MGINTVIITIGGDNISEIKKELESLLFSDYKLIDEDEYTQTFLTFRGENHD